MEALQSQVHHIRFTIVDRVGSTSFVGPCHAIKMLVAACSRDAATLHELLQFLERYDERFATQVSHGLSIFDEHNLRGNTAAIERVLTEAPPHEWPPFRVYNHVTRNASTQPTGSGMIIFNLEAKRIIQVQNNYSEILRRDCGRHREAGRPVRRLYHYELPRDWALVP